MINVVATRARRWRAQRNSWHPEPTKLTRCLPSWERTTTPNTMTQNGEATSNGDTLRTRQIGALSFNIQLLIIIFSCAQATSESQSASEPLIGCRASMEAACTRQLWSRHHLTSHICQAAPWARCYVAFVCWSFHSYHNWTLFRMLGAKRESLPDVPAVYFAAPTDENIRIMCEDLQRAMYDSFYLNTIGPIQRQQLEELASASVYGSSTQLVQKASIFLHVLLIYSCCSSWQINISAL